MSKWWYPHTLTPEQVAAGVGIDGLPENWPPGTEVGLANEFMGKILETRAKNLNYEKEYCKLTLALFLPFILFNAPYFSNSHGVILSNRLVVNILAVRPEYQRKGLGGLLLEHGLALADRDGARTYIEASKKGFPLYKKYGWKEFDEVVVDTRPYGGLGLEVTKLMMREPQPLKN
jgi:GNAT superfamily N-acetyltransferase